MKKICVYIIMFALAMSVSAASKMDSRVRKVPHDLTEKIFEDPDDESIAKLARTLTLSISETTPKLKVIHDWICDNIAYDTDIFVTGEVRRHQTPCEVLKKRKAICIGYCKLFAVMCDAVGIKVEIISGWSKGVGFPGYIAEYPDHAWNAVKLGKKVVLIDVTWDAGWCDYEEYVKHYTTEWFMRTPKEFIWSHLPEKDEEQFLPKVKTQEEFIQEPYVPCCFFDAGVSFTKKIPGYNNYISDMTTDSFNFSRSNVLINTTLKNEKTGQNFESGVWFDRYNGKLVITYDIPTAEKYKLSIFAGGILDVEDLFSVAEYEQKMLPQIQAFLNEEKITQEEYDYYVASYRRVDKQKRYYYNEDCFDTPRNNAVHKINKLLGSPIFIKILSYYIFPTEEYGGCGVQEPKFPKKYLNAMDKKSTVLISPLTGVLQCGETYSFSIKSTDYRKIALIDKDNKFYFFNKNSKTGVFQLDYLIPDDIEELEIYSSTDEKDFQGIWVYKIKR